MDKENLVLIHSFPTNSILLQGLIDYLSDYFNVYFIDLPGFTRQVPPLRKITWEGYVAFVEEKIRAWNLPHYVAGGISFGFLILNNACLDKRCKGLLAIEPYIGWQSLRMKPITRFLIRPAVKLIAGLHVGQLVWQTNWLRNLLARLRNYPPGTIGVMLDEIDSRTFFETANLLLSDRAQYHFKDLPHVLIANENDHTVDFSYIHKRMIAEVKRLLVITTDIEHYPRDTSKRYFAQKLPAAVIQNVLAFLTASP